MGYFAMHCVVLCCVGGWESRAWWIECASFLCFGKFRVEWKPKVSKTKMFSRPINTSLSCRIQVRIIFHGGNCECIEEMSLIDAIQDGANTVHHFMGYANYQQRASNLLQNKNLVNRKKYLISKLYNQTGSIKYLFFCSFGTATTKLLWTCL